MSALWYSAREDELVAHADRIRELIQTHEYLIRSPLSSRHIVRVQRVLMNRVAVLVRQIEVLCEVLDEADERAKG